MIAVFRRLATEWRNRGAAGFVRFVAARLMQRRADELYEMDLAAWRSAGLPPADPQVVLVDRHNLGSPAVRMVEQGVLTAENHAYRESLAGQDQLLALTDDAGQVRSYGFVIYESFYKRVLGQGADVPMISNCYTPAAFRGQGLYPRLLRATCAVLAAQGHDRAIITCAPDNLASVRGIEKAGFRHVCTLSSLVLGARWIAWQKSIQRGRP